MNKENTVSEIEVQSVRGRRDMNAFIDLPFAIYEEYPLWVPPLKSEEKDLLTPGRHPYWEHARRELFLARRGGRVVGRLAAIEDRNANSHQDVRMCVWGFFECENDPEAAKSLFDAAEQWAAARGLEFMRGPMNPSTNYIIGMLVEPFELPPAIMMPWTPPYYLELMDACGMVKEKDLLGFRFDRSVQLPDWVVSLSSRLTEKSDFSLRTVDVSRLGEEVRLMNRIYNECWKDNWGFVPMTDAEIERSAKELKHVVDPEMAFFIYHGDDPVACGLFLPDVNPLLRRFNGKIGLSGLVKLFLYKKEITGCRALLFGVKEEYKKLGVPLVAFDYVFKKKDEKTEYDWIEMSWNLEDNDDINHLLEDFGGECYKRYRLFRREVRP